MAPVITRALSKGDRGGEELLLELEALHQALQSRSHTRSKSLVNYDASPLHAAESKSSCKHPLKPKPSFKVPFRSASISCDRPRRLLSSTSTKQSQQLRPHARKEMIHHLHSAKECSSQLHRNDRIEHFKYHGDGHRQQKSKGGQEEHSEKQGQHNIKNKVFQYDQTHQRKGIWSWRPLRAFSHMILGSRCRFNALFSLQVQRIESLPLLMNGLSLTVLWICKGHCLQTTPSRVVDGVAIFGETLQYQCTIFSIRCSNKISRYDAKPCTLSITATGLDKLELAKHHVNLSSLLPSGDVNGSLARDNCHDASYELSGMAKGGTLIVTFCYNLVPNNSLKANHGIRFPKRKMTLLTKSLPLLQDGTPLVESKSLSPPCQSEPRPAVHHCHSMGHLNDGKWDTLQDSSIRDGSIEAADLCSDDVSDLFEFKAPRNDNHLVEFSFSHTHFVTTDDTTPYYERLPPFSHTDDGFIVEGEQSTKTHVLPEQIKLQKPCYSSQNKAPTGSLSFEVGRCLKQSKADCDDDLDSVAEEFLNMLGMGFDAGHHNSEDDSESPRERLLRQFEEDSLFMKISQ